MTSGGVIYGRTIGAIIVGRVIAELSRVEWKGEVGDTRVLEAFVW